MYTESIRGGNAIPGTSTPGCVGRQIFLHAKVAQKTAGLARTRAPSPQLSPCEFLVSAADSVLSVTLEVTPLEEYLSVKDPGIFQLTCSCRPDVSNDLTFLPGSSPLRLLEEGKHSNLSVLDSSK
jgi:hypothetical protein